MNNELLKKILGSLILLSGVVYIGMQWSSGPEKIAERILAESLKNPDSAYFTDSTIIEKWPMEGGTNFVASVTIVATNSYGAKLKETFCVAFHENDGKVHYDPNNSGSHIIKCSTPPTSQEIALIKTSGF